MIFINIKLIIIKLIMIIVMTKRQRNIFEVLAFYFQRELLIMHAIWINCQSLLVYSREIMNNTWWAQT